MTRSNPYTPSFNAGELSPRLWARSDFSKYRNAVEIAENVIPLAEGGMARRPGSRYVAAVKDSDVKGRLERFQFSTTQAYAIELADRAMRFFRHQGQITVAQTDAVVANGDFTSGIASWTDDSGAGSQIAHDATNGRLSLTSNGTTEAAAEQTVSIGSSYRSAEHVIRFRVFGAPGDKVRLRAEPQTASGSVIGDATSNESAAFDGDTSQALADCAQKTGTSIWLGKDWGAGAAKTIGRFKIYGASDVNGFITGGDPNITIKLQGSATGAWTGEEVDLYTVASASDDSYGAPGAVVEISTAIDTSTAYRYHRVLLDAGTISDWRIAEVEFYPTLGLDREFPVGFHCWALTPGDASVTLRFSHSSGKTLQIDEVEFLSGEPLDLGAPWEENDLYQLDGPQSADVLYRFHGDHPTYKLERYGHSSWSLVEVAWQDGPWMKLNDTSTTFSVSAASVGLGRTLTASATTGINEDRGFLSTDVGRLVRLDNPASGIDWGWGIITAVASPTSATIDIKREFGATTADTRWRLGAWSGTTGYPSCGAFYEQRLYAAATTKQPQTFWASQTGDFENMSPDSADDTSGNWDETVEDDDALDYTISSDDVHTIRWMSPGADVLVIGTAGGEWVPSSQGAVLTPSDISVRAQTTHGSAAVYPLRVDHVVLFLQKAKRKIREFGFDFQIDGYRAFDMTRLAQHVSKGGIVEMDYAEEPDSMVWAVREDGQAPTMTFRREEDVVGWSRQIAGGSFGSGDAVIESVVCIPGADGDGQVLDSTDRDEVWWLVKRTIDGQTKRYIEVLERPFETGDDQDYACYADSAITYDGSAATTITGLDHLEGETVKVLADGAVREDATVANGQITLDVAASVVTVGLAYTHRIKTLRIEGGTAAGTAIGKTKRIVGVTAVVLDSLIWNSGPSLSKLKARDKRAVSDEMDAAVPFFTGEDFIEWDSGWSADERMWFTGDAPVPFTLLALAPELDTKELK